MFNSQNPGGYWGTGGNWNGINNTQQSTQITSLQEQLDALQKNYEISNAKPPEFNYTPSQQWLDQLAKTQQPQGLFGQQQQPFNIAPTRTAPLPSMGNLGGGLWNGQTPNAGALASHYLKGK